MRSYWSDCSSASLRAALARRVLWRAAILFALTLVARSVIEGQATGLSVAAAPDSLSLGPNGVGTATLIVRNASAGLVRRIRLRATADPELDVAIDNPAVHELDPSGAFITSIRIVGRAPVQSPRRVQVFAEFERRTAGAERDALAVEVTTIKVAPGPYERAEQIAEIQLSSSLSTLADTDTGVVYLVIKNKADSELRVDSVLASSPSFLQVRAGAAVKIPPFSSGYVPIRVHAKDEWVQSGKHLLIFDVQLSWTTASGPRLGRAVHSKEVEVSVLGENEILKAVAVPSFLLLPGALMILAFGLLWRYAPSWRGSNEKTDLPLGATTSAFWVLAITLSGLMAFAYPRFGGRNYLHGYGVSDVARIWLISVLIGTLAYAASSRVKRTLIWRRTGRITPRANDTPLEVLRKLALQKGSLRRPLVSYTSGGIARQALLLQPADGGAGRVVVGPFIVVKWTDAATTKEQTELDTLLSTEAPATVADFLEQRLNEHVELRWRPAEAGSVDRPTPVDVQDTRGAREMRLVEVAEVE